MVHTRRPLANTSARPPPLRVARNLPVDPALRLEGEVRRVVVIPLVGARPAEHFRRVAMGWIAAVHDRAALVEDRLFVTL